MPHLFSVGVISDVQYADAPDGTDHRGEQPRCYRGALDQLRRAVDYFNRQRAPDGSALTFVAQLGDLIDGQSASTGQSAAALDAVLAHIRRSSVAFVNLIGNHELYNFDREQCAALLGTRPEGRTREFYALAPATTVRVLVLDAFQQSVIGWPVEEPRRQAAVALLRAKHPNGFDPNMWTSGLEGEEKRFSPLNGALGEEQLDWLGKQLDMCQAARMKGVVLSHVVLHPAACHGKTMAWDYDRALEAFRRHTCVAAVLCGHEHKGGYAYDAASHTHHVTFRSPLNKGNNGAAFGLVSFFDDHIEVRGGGPSLDDLVPLDKISAGADANATARIVVDSTGGGEMLVLPLG